MERTGRVGLTTERLVRAGAELADEIGFEQATPTELARRFGVRTASLYAHVRNAHDLKTRIALLALEELADRASEAVAGRAGKDALTAFADTYRDYALAHPGRFAASQFRLDAETAAASAGVRHAQLMRAVLRGYDLAEPQQTHAVRLLGSVFSGYARLEGAGGFSHSAPGAQESWSEILHALDALLRSWPPPPDQPRPTAPRTRSQRPRT
ncbi:TetR/AcrR family transcriptional regulator [Streptomyces sp. NPDC006512]|uniref:TetR/AcrR family transcriptional regulator n=1 Tax=Streptomyces sp. NPDC006512 TaxID=3154307 RepID=UPI0033B806F1